jgi:hypothetical protein
MTRGRGAGIADDFVKLIVDREGGSIRFDGEFVAHMASGHAITVAIKRQPEIFMHERLGPITVVRKHARQRSERSGLETLFRRLSGFAMPPWISDFFQPLAGLRIHIRQVGEGAQRPKVLAHTTARSTLPFSQAAA